MPVARHRSGLLTAGAVLTIIAGALGLIDGIRGDLSHIFGLGLWELETITLVEQSTC